MAPLSSAQLLHHVTESQKDVFAKDIPIPLCWHTKKYMFISSNNQTKRPVLLGVVAHACDPSTREVERREL